MDRPSPPSRGPAGVLAQWLSRARGQATSERRPRVESWDVQGRPRYRLIEAAEALLSPVRIVLGDLSIHPRANDLGGGQRYLSIHCDNPRDLRTHLAGEGISFREVGPRTRIYLGPRDVLPRSSPGEVGHRNLYLPSAAREPNHVRELREAMDQTLTQITGKLPFGRNEDIAFDYSAMGVDAVVETWRSQLRLTFDPHDVATARACFADEVGRFRHQLTPSLVANRGWQGDVFVLDFARDYEGADRDHGQF